MIEHIQQVALENSNNGNREKMNIFIVFGHFAPSKNLCRQLNASCQP